MSKVKVPLDVTKVKQGDELVTRDGTKVYFVAHDPNISGCNTVLRSDSGAVYWCHANGNARKDKRADPFDIFMWEEDPVVYVNLYAYSSETDAKDLTYTLPSITKMAKAVQLSKLKEFLK